MLSALVKTNLNSDNQGQNNPSTEWIPLSEAAQFTPYSADYLSLLARKKRLTAKKIDGIWYTTKGIINNYLTQQAKRAEALNQSADNYLPFISESVDPISQNVSEVPESNIRYSHTYAEDFQKIRGDLGQQISPVATDEASVNKVPETPVVTLPPVLVSLPQKLPVASEVNYRNVSEPSEVIASGEEIASTPDTLKITQSNRRIEAPRYTTPATPAPELSPNKSVSGDELMEEFMRRFNAQIDRQVDSQHGFLFKVGRFIRRSYGYSLRSPKRLPLFIACLFLVVILPLRFVSGFADNFLADTMYAVKNAQTVMGFRPGTHENEILLLGPEGEIAIFGNVETEGQFRSYVEDGIAPITVKSTTKVENLNADMLDGVSGHEFTLAYVTKNGNITYEPVFLEGTVEVGETLLVKGATKLLNSLEVDGNLSVFGEANFAKGISVSGPAIFKDILTAPSVIVSGLLRAHKLIVEEESIFEGLVTIKDDLDVEGSITASSGRIKGSFRVEEGFHAMQNVSLGSDAYTVRVTSAEWSVDNDGNAVFANVTGEDGDFSNLSVGGNASASTFTATNPNATSTFEGALSVGTTTSYEMLTLDGAFYLASIAAPTATSSRLHNQDGTLYWAGSAFAGPSLGTWSTDGTNVWRTTGNVGIGTSSPNVRLHVDGGDVRFNSTGGGPGLYFDESTGRLGLSTTTPDSLLTVAGTTNITGATTLGSTLNVIGNTTLANASTTNLTVSTNSYLGTVLSGTWNGSTIGVPYGGTGATSLTGLIIGNGTSAMTATTTSAGLATVLTDETGSGFAVFSVSPTFTGSATFADLIATNATTTTLTTTNFNCTDCLNDSEIEDIYVFNTGDSISGNLTFSGTAANIALGSNYLSGDGGDEGIFVDSNGSVGIGTTTPTQLFSVAGNTYITGGLGIGIATTSSGVLETAGNARIGGSLAVVGTTTTDKLAVNSYVISDLIPEVNAFYNLGSSARYWNDAYIDTLTVNNISAASTSISGTQSESFTINSDNTTADTENMDLVFYRGTVVPNALISWDAVRDRFDINQPFFIQNDSSTTTVVTLDVHGTAGQTADIFRVASSTGASFLNVTAGGNVGIGTTTPGSTLTVAGTTNITGATTLGSTLTVAGTTNITGATTLGSTLTVTGNTTLANASTTNLTVSTNSYLGTVLSGTWNGSTLSVPYGGTGATSLTGLLLGNGTSAFTATTTLSSSYIEDAYVRNIGDTMTGNLVMGGTAANIALGSNYLSGDGGDEGIFVDSNGSVGIGTTTPLSLLHLSAAAQATFMMTDTRTAGNQNGRLVYDGGTSITGGGWVFQKMTDAGVFSSNLVTIVQNTGNVGIGETAPGSKLSVSGGGSFGASYDTTAAPTNGLIIEGNVGIGTTTPTTQLQLYRTSNAFPATSGSTQSAGQQLRLGGGAQAVLDFGSNGTSGAWIQSTLGTNLATNYPLLLNPNGGNVGIGTTTPADELVVAGNIDVTGQYEVDGVAAVHGSGNDIYGNFRVIRSVSTSNDGMFIGYSGTGTGLRFYGNSGTTERMRLHASGGLSLGSSYVGTDPGANNLVVSGNVGIGTTTPSSKLHIEGTTAILSNFDNNTNSGVDEAIAIQASTDGANTTNYILKGSVSGAATDYGIYVTGEDYNYFSGNVGIGTSTPTAKLSVQSTGFNLAELYGTHSSGVALIINAANGGNKWSLVAQNSGGVGGGGGFGIADSTAGAYRMFFDTSGNVGIGTTTPAAKLNVLSTTEQLRLAYSSSVYWSDVIASDGGRTLTGFGSDGDFDIVLSGSTDGDFSINGDDLFVDTSAGGFVGIGTIAPLSVFSVTGPSAAASAAASGAGGIAQFTSGTGLATDNKLMLGFYDTDNYAWIQSVDPGTAYRNLALNPNGGNVGIGTTTPGKLLHVYGSDPETYIESSSGSILSLDVDSTSATLTSTFRTGGYKPLYLQTGGSTRLAIDTSGNVGIGTTSPTNLLEVGSGALPALSGKAISLSNTSGNSTIGLGQSTTARGRLSWFYNATEANSYMGLGDALGTHSLILQDIGGNVGIGNTTPASKLTVGTEVTDDNAFSYDSNSLMVVHQTPTATATLNDPKTVLMLARQGTSGQAYGAAAAFNVSRYENSSTNSRTRLDISLAHTTFDVTSNTVMTLLSSGNVGIGDTAPSEKLTIGGGGQTGVQAGASDGVYINPNHDGAQMTVETNSGVEGGILAYDPSNVLYIGSWSANDVRFRASNTDYMTLTTAGNVGIGTTTPGFKLQLDLASPSGTSNALANGLLIRSFSSANGIELRHGSATGFLAMNPDSTGSGALGLGTKGAFPLYFYTNAGLSAGTPSASGIAMTILNGGNVGIGDTTPAALLTVGNGDLFQVSSTGAITAPTLNTGQGAYELYAMNQNVQTTDTPTFSGIIINGSGSYVAGALYSDSNYGMIFRAKQASPAIDDFMWANSAGTERMSITNTGVVQIAGNTAWHAGNDGAGSTLDADLLDGISSASFLRSDTNTTYSGGVLSVYSQTGVDVTNTSQINGVQVYQPTAGADALMTFHIGGDYAVHFGLDGDTNDLTVGGWSMGAAKYKIWHAGNDGAGSTLDADLLDGISSASFLQATSIDTSAELAAILTDETGTGSAVFSANPTFTGTVSAASVTLSGLLTQSASGIRVGSKDDLSTRIDSGFYETSSATTAEGWPENTSTWAHLISSTHSNTGNYYSMQIAGSFFDQGLYFRKTAGVGSTAWSRFLSDSYTTLANGANRTIQIAGETTGVAGRHLYVLGGDGGTGAAGGNIFIAGGAPGGVGSLGNVILGSDSSGTYGNVGIQDGTPTEAMLVVGNAGAGDIYLTLSTAGTTNNAVCWDNAGATLLYDCDATPADYAESYPVDEGITYGDIVMTSSDTITQTDGQTVSKLVKAEKGSEHAVIGIVSNNYHDFTSAGSESINPEDNPMPVALSGRVPVKVNLEGGEIEVGDSVILSSEPGVATKATSTGERIGIALESYEGGDDTVLVFVDNGMYYAPDFLAFITKGEVELPEGDTLFNRLVTLAESFVDGVLKLASAEIQYVKADKVETNELCVGSVCVDEGTFLQMVEKSGGTVHAMEHDPEPEPEENTATSTDDGAGEGETGGGGDTTPEVDDTVTEETPTNTEEDPVSEETTPAETEVIEEESEAETPPADTEEETTDEVAEEPAPESAG